MPDLNCAVLRLTLTSHEDYKRVSPQVCVVAHGVTPRDAIAAFTPETIYEALDLRATDDPSEWNRNDAVALWLRSCAERGEAGFHYLTFDLAAVEDGLADEEWLAQLHVFSLAHMLEGQGVASIGGG